MLNTGAIAAVPGKTVNELKVTAAQRITINEIEAKRFVATRGKLRREVGERASIEPTRNSHIRQGVPKNAINSGFGRNWFPIDK
ncbi:unannotated protein [freshwater metagenome]|uniref:Unannotated protein n=1 Tax=freshwater metagenome TaxID=449393 RepID=A0A6J6HHH1_9ZZZZ